jgi:hypothetical protein
MKKSEIQAVIDRGGCLLRNYGGRKQIYQPTRVYGANDYPECLGYFFRDGIRDKFTVPQTITDYWREATPEEIKQYVK